MQNSFCSVSIDLDSLRYYYQIHGLRWDPQSGVDPVYSRAMPRFLDLFEDLGIRATFFVIGQDLEQPEHVKVLQEAVSRGHELANHTYYHPYRLTELPNKELETDIMMGEEAINNILPDGQRVLGFRCPGYNIHGPVLEVLRKRNYLYDSSIFPSAPYYLAKGAVIAYLSLKRTPSRSMLGSPRVMLSPQDPYHPGLDPHTPQKKIRDLWEIPIATIPKTGLPFIGTHLLLYPQWSLPSITRLVTRRYRLLNLELHGIDFLDPKRDPGLQGLLGHQPDLKVTLPEKRSRFGQILQQIKKSHKFLPLAEAISWY